MPKSWSAARFVLAAALQDASESNASPMLARFTLFAALSLAGALATRSTLFASTRQAPPTTQTPAAPDITTITGDWIYVEDRTAGRSVEQQRPSMGARFGLRVEEDAIVVVQGTAAQPYDVRLRFDGATSELKSRGAVSQYSGGWRNGVLEYRARIETPGRDGPQISESLARFEPRPEGLVVRVSFEKPSVLEFVALYRRPQDIPLPTPAPAKIDAVAWLSGAWVGTQGVATLDERWSPAAGGALMGTSRTIARGNMVAFEFLRIVERDTSLVYVAQPNGATPTEFTLVELGEQRAVFLNPRHDFPQRISYELSPDGLTLTALVGHTNGGRPQRFEFRREGR
jgi:hypothetical protein